MSTQFKTATDFRKSLGARLQALSEKTGEDLQRLRRKVAFDRFLARIFHHGRSEFYLKGGYAMELRIAHARATKDIDLTYTGRIKSDDELLSELILGDLQTLARLDLKDQFTYQIGKPLIDLDNAPYGGARYSVTSLIDGKLFVRFQLDVGADFLLDQIEAIQGTDWLSFCGILAPTMSMISVEQQFAEKLHAYTLPRAERINSRTQDLIDMVLLLNIRTPTNEKISQTIQDVFRQRATHPLPQTLTPPPSSWKTHFETLATECGLSTDMDTHFNRISTFYTALKVHP